MTLENKNNLKTENREIVATRIFNAPREIVFQMWTDPQHIAKWWGPKGFTNTIHEMDVRPGGEWRFIMHGPDGKDYNNKVIYIEIKKNELIIYDHISGPKFRATVTFDEIDGKTKLTMTMLFKTETERDQTVEKFGAVEGLKQTLGKLEEYISLLRIKVKKEIENN